VTDWTTISSLATAGGTLVLAVATFSSVRSANRAARTAERALQVGLRPVLVASRLQDPDEKIMWVDRHWAKVPGGHASVEIANDIVYLAISVRNVGSGIGVLHGWHPWVGGTGAAQAHLPPEEFRMQMKDMYVAPGDTSFWQGAIRERDDPHYGGIRQTIEQREMFTIDLLYGDHEGGQRTISRFGVVPSEIDEGWLCSVARHWNLDRQDPR
jgi:hypothetical protein